jgi:hypothetical protein
MGPFGARATTPAISVVVRGQVRSGANDNHSRTSGTSNRIGAAPCAGDRRSLAPQSPAVSPAMTSPATLRPAASSAMVASSERGTAPASGLVLNRTSCEKPPSQVRPDASTACGAT